jgi:eukaryotic-like serine/threonine-protein kinase
MVQSTVKSDEGLCATQLAEPSLADPTRTSEPLPSFQVASARPEKVPQLRDQARYDFLSEHGRGGLGRITRAYDRELGRDIAIKELISGGHISELRFFREALITARLEHPGIVPVHEAGRWGDGTPFYAMKLVAGRSLRDLIAERKTVDERIRLLHHVIAVADAIAYAHGRNIIHRDLKPSNVIVGDFGETVVIDWGLAKDLTADDEPAIGGGPFRAHCDDGLTSAGTILGTPAYMAPEQARGEPVDQRADVFAIGVMLWELCSLERLPPGFTGERRVLLGKTGIDPDLAAIIDKACSPEPARRYANAAALAADLKAFKAGARIAARSYSLYALLTHWTRRHRMLAASVIGAVSLAIIAGILYVRAVASERDRADVAVDRLEATNDKLAHERAVAVEQRNALILAQATAALDSDPTRALEWLETYPADGAGWGRVQVIAADAQSRGLARHIVRAMSATIAISRDGKRLLTAGPHDVAHVWDLETGQRIRSYSSRGPIAAGRLSPDDMTIALGDRSGDVVLWDPQHDTHRVLGKLDGGALYVAFSPDGRELASSSLHSVVIWDLASSRQVWSMASPQPVTILATSPVDPVVAFGTADGVLHIWDMAQQRGRELRGHDGAINDIAFSPDGRQIATGGRDHSVRLWDLAANTGRVLGRHDNLVRHVAFSPADPTLIASGGADHEVRLWSSVGHGNRVFSGHTDMVNCVTFSPDGAMLASAAPDRQVRLWDVATGESRVLRGHRGDLGDVMFSPDGKTLVSSGYDEGTRIWRFVPPPSRILGQHEFEAVQAVFSPDGRYVASTGSDKTARLWNLSSGKEQVLPGSEYSGMAFATGVVFSPDGELLASVGDNAAHLWNLSTGEARRFVAEQTLLRRVALSADRKLIAAGGSDGNVRVWDVASNQLTVLTGHKGEVSTLAFCPRADCLVSAATDRSVWRWDLTASPVRGHPLGSHPTTISHVAVAPGGRLAASASDDGLIKLWDLATGTFRALPGHSGGICELAFTPDGRLLASASMDRTARIWDVATGEARVLRGHDEAVRAVAFSRDGKIVATGGNDQTVRVWNLENGDLTILRGHHAIVRSVAFDASAKQLVSASEDATIRLWDLDQIRPVPRDRARLTSWLTTQTSAVLPGDVPGLTSNDHDPSTTTRSEK